MPNFRLLTSLDETAHSIAVLDRTKEPGSAGEPLYLDVVNAVYESGRLTTGGGRLSVVGGRYGLSSKEFTPAMVQAVYDELKKARPKNHFTVGIIPHTWEHTMLHTANVGDYVNLEVDALAKYVEKLIKAK